MPKSSVVRVDGLNTVLRALRKFPKEAQSELRDESQRIADGIMVPAYRAATASVGSWGPKLADGIRSKRDRIPAVNIGYARGVYSGGASSSQLRWPTFSGDRGNSYAPFYRTQWIYKAAGYKPQAMEAWGDAIERVVNKWNRVA